LSACAWEERTGREARWVRAANATSGGRVRGDAQAAEGGAPRSLRRRRGPRRDGAKLEVEDEREQEVREQGDEQGKAEVEHEPRAGHVGQAEVAAAVHDSVGRRRDGQHEGTRGGERGRNGEQARV